VPVHFHFRLLEVKMSLTDGELGNARAAMGVDYCLSSSTQAPP
jgi:hypothetical protein